MNRYTRWAFALTLLPVAACSSNSPPMSAAPAAPPSLATADQTFINAAATSDANEIQQSQLADSKARNPRIKQYAAKMIADHTKTSQQLTTLAQSKGATVTPTPPDPAIQAKLDADKGAAFDRDYMRDQVNGHMTAVQAFQDEIANGQDPDLKAFAQQGLPIIQQHLTMARQIGGIRAPSAATAGKASKAPRTAKS